MGSVLNASFEAMLLSLLSRAPSAVTLNEVKDLLTV